MLIGLAFIGIGVMLMIMAIRGTWPDVLTVLRGSTHG